MNAEVQKIAHELKVLRSGKRRIFSVPHSLRLKIAAIAHEYGLKEAANGCTLHCSTVRKWPEYSNPKSIPCESKKAKPAPLFTVTHLPPLIPAPAVVTLVRADGATLSLPAESLLAEKAVALFLEGC